MKQVSRHSAGRGGWPLAATVATTVVAAALVLVLTAVLIAVTGSVSDMIVGFVFAPLFAPAIFVSFAVFLGLQRTNVRSAWQYFAFLLPLLAMMALVGTVFWTSIHDPGAIADGADQFAWGGAQCYVAEVIAAVLILAAGCRWVRKKHNITNRQPRSGDS
jgi:hypothetical protein